MQQITQKDSMATPHRSMSHLCFFFSLFFSLLVFAPVLKGAGEKIWFRCDAFKNDWCTVIHNCSLIYSKCAQDETHKIQGSHSPGRPGNFKSEIWRLGKVSHITIIINSSARNYFNMMSLILNYFKKCIDQNIVETFYLACNLKNSQAGIKGFTWFVKRISCAHMPLYCNCFVTESKLNYEVPKAPVCVRCSDKGRGKCVGLKDTVRMNKFVMMTNGWNSTRHPLKKDSDIYCGVYSRWFLSWCRFV